VRVLRAVRVSLPYLAFLITLLWMANFFWLFGESQALDGDTLNGMARDGHYYLGSHGTYREVSRAVWERLRLHELSVWLSLPPAPVCTWYWMVGHAFARMMGLHQGGAVVERVRAVRASGMRLAAGRCGGSIGGVGLGGPFLAVGEYMTIRLFPRRPVAILKAELTRVEGSTGLFNREVRITHTSPDISSPILLYISPLGDLAAALHGLAARAEVRL
jgi:hypothetical protein